MIEKTCDKLISVGLIGIYLISVANESSQSAFKLLIFIEYEFHENRFMGKVGTTVALDIWHMEIVHSLCETEQ